MRDVHTDDRHYVYRLFDQQGRLIYVGCSYNPETRISQHRQTMWWANQIRRVKLTVHPNKKAGHAAEQEAIREVKPRWNVNCKWVYRESWTTQDISDYIKALELHPERATQPRLDRIAEAKRLLLAREHRQQQAA